MFPAVYLFWFPLQIRLLAEFRLGHKPALTALQLTPTNVLVDKCAPTSDQELEPYRKEMVLESNRLEILNRNRTETFI